MKTIRTGKNAACDEIIFHAIFFKCVHKYITNLLQFSAPAILKSTLRNLSLSFHRKTPSQLKQELEIGQGGMTPSLVEDEWQDPYTSGSRDNSAVYDDFFGEKYGGDNKKN